jgi:hypothetical protein
VQAEIPHFMRSLIFEILSFATVFRKPTSATATAWQASFLDGALFDADDTPASAVTARDQLKKSSTRRSAFDVERWMFSGRPTIAGYALYRRRFLCRCAFMRLRRLCLAIFDFRLFLREPIQISRFPNGDSTI